jgi:hypothetical protein
VASDALFLALSNALSQPSKSLRAVQSAGEAGQGIIGGYMQGKQLGQQLEQYKLLSTPLGSMYSDPSQIPFGLGPQHTVKDLLTIAPAMENYVPANVLGGAAKAFGANVSSGGAGGDGSGGGTPPPPSPSPAIAGSANPPQTPGATALGSTEGAGAGGGANLPPGTPDTIAPSSGPALTLPPGGMSMKGFQNVVLPALKAGQEGRQFQQNQAGEESRFQRGKVQEANQFSTAQTNEKNRALAAQQDEFTKSINRTMSGFDALDQLNSLYDKIPPTQKGAYVGQITKYGGTAAGATSPELSTYNQARHAFIGNFAAALDPMGRQNQALLAQVESMTPKVEDDPRVASNKVAAMHQFLTSTVNRNYQGFNAAANQIGGDIQQPAIPPNTYFESEADVDPNLPQGTIIHVAGRKAVIR